MLPLVVATLLACSAMCVADPLKGVEWLVAQGRHGYPVEYYVEPVIETRGGHFTVCESGPAVEPFERWLRYTAGYYGTSERPVANAFVHVIMGDSSQETFQVKVNSKDKESPCFSPTEVTSEAYYHKFLADLNEICTDNAFRMHKAGGPGILVGRYFGAIDHGQQTLELELDHGSLSAASTNGIQGALQFMGFGDAFVYASVKGHDSIRMMILRRNPPSDSEHRRIGRENLETWDHIKAPIGIFHTRIHRVRHG
ncbi:hypothetical protein Pmar_PMAR017520 [Perkinsus marinus ATCC 50983]|uniref:Uncharacterized protein n=1 Tax=Perkinsus marinus (strain ATCC 50983 / TXsc) TaxID=423536 RepID=C5KVU0_PERM5|nr:hypothetical protein Pmar_PMAR017520 [Perkinsus marinus ATCC 50983]EER11403.1 hypothetical protein Pmar_PMAR017520 [Perkinsus marinus ATCC 50983]|eukprot:XP_002779608.1 hypothetical protein Pmar_PMAR017520 [Perkinsus marinus ATCC 50983]